MTSLGDIRISTYGNFSSGNYGMHCMCVCVPGLKVWYSYSTIIAFDTGEGIRISENVWKSTTAKHLNLINKDKSVRMERGLFEEELKEALNKRLHGKETHVPQA